MRIVRMLVVRPQLGLAFGLPPQALAMDETMFFLGWLVGSLLGGALADLFGRRPLFLLCNALVGLCGAGMAAAPGMAAYACVHSLEGAALGAYTLVAWTLAAELWPTPDARARNGLWFQQSNPLGFVLGVGLAWLVPGSWRLMTLLSAVPSLVLALPVGGGAAAALRESPVWLLSRGRADEASAVLQAMAREHGRPDLRVAPLVAEDAAAAGAVSPTAPPAASALRQLCCSAGLRGPALGMLLLWFTTSFVYMGISFRLAGLVRSLLLSNALAALAETPGYFLAMRLLASGRRRTAVVLSLLAAGGCLAHAVAAPGSSLATAAGLAGKMAVTGAYGSLFLYSSELFPTAVRSTAMGLCGVVSRLGEWGWF